METLNSAHPRGPFRAAVIDFDGTLSLLRRGWQQVMIPMAVEYLSETNTSETHEQLHTVAEDFITRLTGRQTIYQMIRLAEEIAKRGGVPREPLDYKRDYHTRLWHDVRQRIDAIRQGKTAPADMTVPGSHELLRALTSCGITCYLASGTDEQYVLDEVALLELDQYFDGHIYGALDDYKKFSKAILIERIIRDTDVPGEAIIGIGDGYVEIEEVKKVGGLAVGVATDEFNMNGINEWKRRRLVEAGADIIIGDFRELETVCNAIGLAAA